MAAAAPLPASDSEVPSSLRAMTYSAELPPRSHPLLSPPRSRDGGILRAGHGTPPLLQAAVSNPPYPVGDVIHAGNAAHGVVRIFGYTHMSMEGQDVTERQLRSHSLVLEQLLRLQPATVFVEGLGEDLDTAPPPAICAAIASSRSSTSRREWAQCLANYRLEALYAALAQKPVRLLAAESVELNDEIYRQLDSGRSFDVMRPQIGHDRERYAWEKIYAYLTQFPGQEVVLLYGANHDFMRHLPLDGRFDPQTHWYNYSYASMQEIESER